MRKISFKKKVVPREIVQHWWENLGENSEALDLHPQEKLPERKTTSKKKGNWQVHFHSIVVIEAEAEAEARRTQGTEVEIV